MKYTIIDSRVQNPWDAILTWQDETGEKQEEVCKGYCPSFGNFRIPRLQSLMIDNGLIKINDTSELHGITEIR